MNYLVYMVADGIRGGSEPIEVIADDVNVEAVGEESSVQFLNFVLWEDEESDGTTVAIFPFAEVKYVISTPQKE